MTPGPAIVPPARFLHLLGARVLIRHPLRTAMAVLAVAAGTAMAVSVPVLYVSAEASVEEFGSTVSGPSELRVVGAVRRGGVSAETVAAVQRTDGVGVAVPMVQAVTLTVPADRGTSVDPGRDGRPALAFGVDCRVAALVPSFDCDAGILPTDGFEEGDVDGGDTGGGGGADNRPVLVGPGLDAGHVLGTNRGDVPLDGVPILTGTDAPVDAAAPDPAAPDGTEGLAGGDLAGGRYAVFPLAAAQRLFERGTAVDVVYVVPEGGQDVDDVRAALEAAVGPEHPVLGADEGPPEIAAAIDDVVPLFSLLALFALGTGAMLVHNTVTLTVERRRRQHAVLGALGAPTSVVRSLTLAEAGAVGLVGGLLGAALGVVVATPIVASLSQYTERVAGIPLAVHVPVAVPVAGTLLGTVAAVLAGVPGARRASRVDVVGELSGRSRQVDDRAPRALARAGLCGLVAAGGLVAVTTARWDGGLSPWQLPVGGIGFAVSAVGLLLAGANLVPVAVRWAVPGAAVRAWPAVRLAVANVVRPAGRTGLMTASLTAAVTTAVLAGSYGSGFSHALTGDIEATMDGVEVSSVASGPNVNLDAGIPPPVLDTLPEVPGVVAVHRGAVVLARAQDGPSLLVSAHQRPWSVDGTEAVRGRLDRVGFDAGEALISTSLARSTGLRPGDRVELPTPDGVVDLPVQAVIHGGSTGEGRVVISYDTHLRLYGPQPVRAVYVQAEEGVDPDVLAGRLRRADLGAEVRVETPAQVVADTERAVDRQMVPFVTLQQALLAVAFVAVLSTMILVGAQRQREMALLAAAGAGPRLLFRMVVAEAALVAGAATVLSVALGLPLLWAMTHLSPLTTGIPVPFRVDWWSVPVAGAAAFAVALVAALWPARRASRVDVVDGLRSE